MAIRFSCDCGATFEVSDEQAGLRGRCLGCGQELTIPHADTPSEEIRQEAEQVAEVPEQPEHKSDTIHGLYCPFCGAFAGKGAVKCPRCSRFLDMPKPVPDERSPLSTSDWILATAFAPLGVVAGFLQLVLGQKKGLDVIGVSVAAILIWWFVFLFMGWIR